MFWNMHCSLHIFPPWTLTRVFHIFRAHLGRRHHIFGRGMERSFGVRFWWAAYWCFWGLFCSGSLQSLFQICWLYTGVTQNIFKWICLFGLSLNTPKEVSLPTRFWVALTCSEGKTKLTLAGLEQNLYKYQKGTTQRLCWDCLQVPFRVKPVRFSWSLEMIRLMDKILHHLRCPKIMF